MSSRKLEDRIAALRRLRTAIPDAQTIDVVRQALQDRSNLIVAEAAKVAAALGLASLVPELLASFNRLFEDPVKSDSKCWGKTAIVKTLTQLEYDQAAPFVRGARHIQMEPVYGTHEDAAPQLRAMSVLALVQCTDSPRFEIMQHLVDALADPADPVRVEAVRALAQMAGDDAALLLRFKARQGDPRPIVIGSIFDALIGLQAADGVTFVARYLDDSSADIRDEAALALGAARRQDALRQLIDRFAEAATADFRSVLLRAISSSRDEAAIQFLLEIVRSGRQKDCQAALDALALHRDSPEIQMEIQRAQNQRRSPG